MGNKQRTKKKKFSRFERSKLNQIYYRKDFLINYLLESAYIHNYIYHMLLTIIVALSFIYTYILRLAPCRVFDFGFLWVPPTSLSPLPLSHIIDTYVGRILHFCRFFHHPTLPPPFVTIWTGRIFFLGLGRGGWRIKVI